MSENNAANTAEATTVEESTEETVGEETVGEETTAGDESTAAPQMEDQADAGQSSEAVEEAPANGSSNAPTRDADGFSSALPSLEDEGAARKHVVGGVGYEIIYVVRSGDQKLVEATGQRVRDLIEKHDGAIDNVRASEVRRFAYPIKKQTEGVYVVINARFKPEYTGEMERFFKLEESVLRHMMLKEES